MKILKSILVIPAGIVIGLGLAIIGVFVLPTVLIKDLLWDIWREKGAEYDNEHQADN